MIGGPSYLDDDRRDSRCRRIGARSLNGIRSNIGSDTATNKLVEIPRTQTERKLLKISNEVWDKARQSAHANGRDLGQEVEHILKTALANQIDGKEFNLMAELKMLGELLSVEFVAGAIKAITKNPGSIARASIIVWCARGFWPPFWFCVSKLK